MQITQINEHISSFLSKVPGPVIDVLSDITWLICESPEAAVQDFQEEIKALIALGEYDADASEEYSDIGNEIPSDCKGVFVGVPVEIQASDESEQDEVVEPAEGFIILCASNIESPDELDLVIIHEMGHALDMTEEELEDIGLGVKKKEVVANATQPTDNRSS